MKLEELVGQKLVFGIEGPQATPEETGLFRETRAGGLILFKRNFTSPEALRRLIASLETALRRKLLVMVDHEGGEITRFDQGVTIFPDAQTCAEAGDVSAVRHQGETEAQELNALGIHINLAPVLDVLASVPNPALRKRTYGKEVEEVSRFGRARIEGLQSKGVSACAKHYPGLGGAVIDPHFDLPVINKPWNALKQTDLKPFIEAFRIPVDCVMSSHPVYPAVDPRPVPATFSRRLMHDCLRLELGFRGVLLSDDLKMGAIAKQVSMREAALLAAKAGHDLLLICSDAPRQREAFKSLKDAYNRKELPGRELEESVERIEALKEKRSVFPAR